MLGTPIYGTAEPVPFVDSLPQPLKVSQGFMCRLNWPTEKSDLDKSVPIHSVERLDAIGKSKTCALNESRRSSSDARQSELAFESA
jgi:hypothetical protein